MVLDIFTGLRLVVKRRSISIDSAIFRCHWFLTSTLLGMFSFIITACQYVGRPIECHSVNKLPDSLLNSYCWVQSTFTVLQACNQQVGSEVPYPCIDNTRGREIKMFAYYQWVGIVLFIQGLLFHLPFYLWKVWENGLIKAITGGLRVAVMSDAERVKKRDIVVEYIHEHLGCHKRYAFKYFLCELICLLNLIAQLWATNKFFDGQFLRYGIDVINYTFSSQSPATTNINSGHLTATATRTTQSATIKQLNATLPLSIGSNSNRDLSNYYPSANNINNARPVPRVDPMTFVFPRMTKCTYYDFGSSGDIQKHDALCLLPLNIINEKIYIALWFWFLVLAILTLLVLIYRFFVILSTNVRCKGLISRCRLSNELDIRVICRHCDVGDWFLFYMVAENLDPLIMREIVAAVANKIREHLELKRRRSSLSSSSSEIAGLSMFEEKDRDKTSGLFAGCNSWRSAQRNTSSDELLLVPSGRNTLTGGKRLYNKRQWSADLGSPELRRQQHLQQQQQHHQPASNPDHYSSASSLPRYSQSGGAPVERQPSRCQELMVVNSNMSSAPPASEMSPVRYRRRWDNSDDISREEENHSLTNNNNNSSTSGGDSFIMEMQPVSAVRHHLHLPAQLGSSSSAAAAASSSSATSSSQSGANGVQRRRYALRKPAFALVFA